MQRKRVKKMNKFLTKYDGFLTYIFILIIILAIGFILTSHAFAWNCAWGCEGIQNPAPSVLPCQTDMGLTACISPAETPTATPEASLMPSVILPTGTDIPTAGQSATPTPISPTATPENTPTPTLTLPPCTNGNCGWK